MEAKIIVITFAFEKGHYGNMDKEGVLLKLGRTSQEANAVV